MACQPYPHEPMSTQDNIQTQAEVQAERPDYLPPFDGDQFEIQPTPEQVAESEVAQASATIHNPEERFMVHIFNHENQQIGEAMLTQEEFLQQVKRLEEENADLSLVRVA